MRASYFASRLILAGLIASFCYGDTMTISSSANTANDSSNPTMVVSNVDPLWAPAFAGSSWVSNVDSGNPNDPNFVLVPNGTTVGFSDTFTVNGTPTSGTLDVMADDTTSVTLNGTELMAQAGTAGNTYKVCSDYIIGCLPSTTGVLNLTQYLLPGVNVIDFEVTQLNYQAFGLDYLGTIDYNGSDAALAPEPATIGLMGLSLVCFSVFLSKKVRPAMGATRVSASPNPDL